MNNDASERILTKKDNFLVAAIARDDMTVTNVNLSFPLSIIHITRDSVAAETVSLLHVAGIKTYSRRSAIRNRVQNRTSH